MNLALAHESESVRDDRRRASTLTPTQLDADRDLRCIEFGADWELRAWVDGTGDRRNGYTISVVSIRDLDDALVVVTNELERDIIDALACG